MLLCPRCRKVLARVEDARGAGAGCPVCGGRALSSDDLGTALPADLARSLEHALRTAGRRGRLPCPACSEAMAEIDAGGGGTPVLVAGCPRCAWTWFGPDGVGRLARPSARRRRTRPSSPEEVVGRFALARRSDLVAEGGVPLASREGLAGWIGFPTLYGRPRSDVRPWATHALAGTLVATSVALLVLGTWQHGLLHAAETFVWAFEEGGFVPADPWRHDGATWFTSTFLHAGLWHLVANVYFLVLAGRDVERKIGAGRLLALFFSADLAGDLLETVVNGASAVPRVGASGGIAGLFAWYAFALPGVETDLYFPDWRSGTRYTFLRVRVPVPWVFSAWVVLQLFGTLGTDPRIAFTSHLGGALAGIGWWLAGRRGRGTAPAVPPVLPPPVAPPSRSVPIVAAPPRPLEDPATATPPASPTGFRLEEEPPPAPRTHRAPVPEAPAEAAPTGSPTAHEVPHAPAWTLSEGIADAVRTLLPRALWATAGWTVAAAAFAFVCRDTAFMGPLPGYAASLAVYSALVGIVVGHAVGEDFEDRVGFAGWVPVSLATGASVVAVTAGTLLVALSASFGLALYGWVVGFMGSAGAAAGALKATWAAE